MQFKSTCTVVLAISIFLTTTCSHVYAVGGMDEDPSFDADTSTTLSNYISPESAPLLGSPAILPSESETGFDLSEDLPEQIPAALRDPILFAGIRTAKETLKKLNFDKTTLQGSEFREFSEGNCLWEKEDDLKVHMQVIQELGSIFVRASHIVIDILTLTEQMERIGRLDLVEKDIQNKENYHSILIPKYREFVTLFTMSNTTLLALLSSCTTYECLEDISSAQTQLITYGESIIQGKQFLTSTPIHPLIQQALETVAFSNSMPHNLDSRPTPYPMLFKIVLDIFMSDFSPLPFRSISKTGVGEILLKTTSSIGNNFEDGNFPPFNPQIKAELKRVERSKKTISTRLNLNPHMGPKKIYFQSPLKWLKGRKQSHQGVIFHHSLIGNSTHGV